MCTGRLQRLTELPTAGGTVQAGVSSRLVTGPGRRNGFENTQPVWERKAVEIWE